MSMSDVLAEVTVGEFMKATSRHISALVQAPRSLEVMRDFNEFLKTSPGKKNHPLAVPCQCGHSSCKDWHVTDFADLQGVHFTEEQALMVAFVLGSMGASE